jgi:hypothetical protein
MKKRIINLHIQLVFYGNFFIPYLLNLGDKITHMLYPYP